MTLEELFNRISALPASAKIGILGLILAIIGGGYWSLFYGDMIDERDRNAQLIVKARQEKKDLEKRKTEDLAFRNEVNQLRDEQKELLKVLPKLDDIEQFIESVNAQVELSGLSKVSSRREKAIPEELYMRIPITMSLVGSFHQINRFFKNVGGLQRIVTITDLQLNPADERTATGAAPLKADFVAQTFQFIDKAAPRKAVPK